MGNGEWVMGYLQVVDGNKEQKRRKKQFVIMKKFFSLALFFGLASLIGYGNAFAQIAPDTSVGTTVTPDVMVNGVISDRQYHQPC